MLLYAINLNFMLNLLHSDIMKQKKTNCFSTNINIQLKVFVINQGRKLQTRDPV